jgi:MFS family permease
VSSEPSRLPWVIYFRLTALYFVQGLAMAMWFVPLTNVLDAHGLQAIKPLAFAASGVAAFISPLFFGAMADRHAAPVTVLRWLAVATAGAMAAASLAMQAGAGAAIVLGLILVHALCSAPAWGLAATVVFSGIRGQGRNFGPIRAVATLGWMAGCWLVSLVGADASVRSGYGGAMAWLAVAGLSLRLPTGTAPRLAGAPTWRERFGLDALTLLRNRDHRVVFVMAALFNMPLVAFYPYTPPHLREVGLEHTAAWMSLGQVTEIVAMLALARLLLRWRLKWIFAAGLFLGGLRFALCALDTRAGLLLGISLHGASYTLVLITAQIYLEERIDPAWRARAQALLSLMVGGVGSVAGYLGSGWWFARQAGEAGTNWPVFWGGLAAAGGAVLAYFLVAYHGRGRSPEELGSGGGR